MTDSARVMAVQMALTRRGDAEGFFAAVEGHVRAAAGYGADFALFPEHFAWPLVAPHLPPADAARALAAQAGALRDRLAGMARRHGVNVVGGSTLAEDGGSLRNVCFVCLRDGAVHTQAKLHPTPDERDVWGLSGGDALAPIPTDRGPVGVLICYDSEFPEPVRHLVDGGARLLFVPYCTDTRQGHLRVRYCCQARAVENQIYVATAGNVGGLADVENLELQYAASAIMTPCDFPFARDGVAAEATENAEMALVADLDLAALERAREAGSVRNLRDRRRDLYRTVWTGRA